MRFLSKQSNLILDTDETGSPTSDQPPLSGPYVPPIVTSEPELAKQPDISTTDYDGWHGTQQNIGIEQPSQPYIGVGEQGEWPTQGVQQPNQNINM